MLVRYSLYTLFMLCAVLGAASLSAPQWVAHLPGPVGRTAAVPPALALVGALVGLLAIYSLDRSSRSIMSDLSDVAGSAGGSSVRPQRGLLGELSTTVETTLAHARHGAEAAQQRARELEIQLKVVSAEREHAESIISSISDAVIVTDAWDELVLANESAARSFDFGLAESQRRPIDQVLRDAKLVALIREMRQSQSVGGRRIVEHRCGRAGREGERVYKLTLACLRQSSGSNGGVVAVLHDMTHEAEVAKIKNDFVSHVSHELRTPLASIRAYIEMLIDGEAEEPKQQREFFEIIQTEANRLGRLIDNILNISRIESGLVKINKQPVSLTVVTNEVLEIIRPQAAFKSISIITQVAPAIDQTHADKDMIHQAVLNLLSNAVKYTPEGGSVTVSTRVDDAARKISVVIKDTGVGIPAKDLPFVFDKFYRVDANSGMAKGTGLGLALVKHIVETTHRGRVYVQSTVGQGSAFCIELDLE